MKKPEQKLWDSVDKTVGSLWRAQRHEDQYTPDIPDVSYASFGVNGWMELKVLDAWPGPRAKLFTATHFTPGQRNWLVEEAKRGNGHCYLLAKIADDFMLLKWDEFHFLELPQSKSFWSQQATCFWEKKLNPLELINKITGFKVTR